jgi:pimeloyl-ACP methyl ester carboxylesterase
MRSRIRTKQREVGGGDFWWVLAAALLALVLGACSTVKVKVQPGVSGEVGVRSAGELAAAAGVDHPVLRELAVGGGALLRGARSLLAGGDPGEAAASYLKAATDSYEILAGGLGGDVRPEAERALSGLYNESLASFIELWVNDLGAASGEVPEFLLGEERYEIVISPASAHGLDYFDRMIAAVGVKEEGVVRERREGIGAAMVGIREKRPERGAEVRFFPGRGLQVPVTVTIDSVDEVVREGAGVVKRVSLALRNPMREQTVKMGAREYPLAADFSAPIALLLAGRNEKLWGLGGFIYAEERIRQAGIYQLEPYDPERIPVLLIHGLISVPIIWRDIVPELMAMPEISKRYQFLVFSYPSSYPVVESARFLRGQLTEFREQFDPRGEGLLSTNMVVAGHSMGGILSHSLVAEVGDRLWEEISDLPLESLELEEAQERSVRELFFFEPDPAVTRAIFIATPHRGAKMAEKKLANFVSRVARLPGNLVMNTLLVLDPRTIPELGLRREIRGKVTAVQSLAPGTPMVIALDRSPYREGVVYHSIIGDRGRGDTPESSDGVVEYWSSRQEGAASELIVPTGHGAYEHPEAIADIKRILLEHVGL